tara:strand:- start:2844 stop:4733 length:1890 start_codon:yes stop_codon:yes gene_type:complete
MPRSGELGLKYELDSDNKEITLHGAELGGPIYRIYDRQSGIQLGTIVIPPRRFINVGEIINDNDFPTKTFLPNTFNIDNHKYTGLIVESRGASQEILNDCGLIPEPPAAAPPTYVASTTPSPQTYVTTTTLSPGDDYLTQLHFIVGGTTTTQAPFPWQQPRDFGVAWPTTPPPCDCIPGTIYLPDRAELSSDGTIGGISQEDWDRCPPILWVPEGWSISIQDPRKFPGYRPECWKEYRKGWPEFAPPGTGGIGTPGVAPTLEEIEQLRYPPPPENAISTETRIYCKVDNIPPGSALDEFSDPNGPWECLPHVDPWEIDSSGEPRDDDRDEEEREEDEEMDAVAFQDRFKRVGPPDEEPEPDPEAETRWGRDPGSPPPHRWGPELEADQKLWDDMSESQRDGWRNWRDRENERDQEEFEINHDQTREVDESRRQVGLPPSGVTWEEMDEMARTPMSPGPSFHHDAARREGFEAAEPPAGVPRREEIIGEDGTDKEAERIRQEAYDRFKSKWDAFNEKWGYDDESFVPSSDLWAPPGWGWSPDRGWHQGNPDTQEWGQRRRDERDKVREKKRKKERDDAWEEQGLDTDREEVEDSWYGPVRIINDVRWYFDDQSQEWLIIDDSDVVDDPFE